jgi:F-type H+-transporting ATPase subunit alpha
VGISVSRVGGAAQTKLMKKVSGTLKLDLAQYREMAAFAQFASDLDPATQRQLARGERLTEMLKQGQYVPMDVIDQIVVIYAANKGYADKYPLAVLRRYEQELLEFMRTSHASVLADLRSKQKLDDTNEADLNKALKQFGEAFDVQTK